MYCHASYTIRVEVDTTSVYIPMLLVGVLQPPQTQNKALEVKNTNGIAHVLGSLLTLLSEIFFSFSE